MGVVVSVDGVADAVVGERGLQRMLTTSRLLP